MKVFISHASKDNSIVRKIVDLFTYYDVEHFVDFNQIHHDSVPQDIINNELKSSTLFLLIWSKNADDSDYVLAEKTSASEYADEEMQKIVYRLDDVKLGYPYSKYHYEKLTSKNLVEEIKKFIYCYASFKSQLKLFKERTCQDYENFTNDKSFKPIINDFKKFDGKNLYVSQSYNFLDNSTNSDVASFCLNRLREKIPGTLLIVGDYGNGKSGLCHSLMYSLCNDLTGNSIPFYIPLGDFASFYSKDQKTILSDLVSYFQKTYKFNLDEKALLELIKKEKPIFIFDALDELSQKLDSAVANSNLKLLQGISEKNSIIVTSRHTYISGGIPTDLVNHKNAIKIEDFNRDQITEFLELKIKKKNERDAILHRLEKDDKLREIVSKPLFLNILCDKFNEIKNLKFVNRAILFRILSVGWIQHDIEKPSKIQLRNTSRIEINQRSSERLAITEYSTQHPVTLGKIKEIIRDEFKSQHSRMNETFDSYIRYARDATYLSVEDEDSFSFLLKPFLEYFVASRIVRDINEYDENNLFSHLMLELTPEIIEFIKSIIEADWLIKPTFLHEVNIDNNSVVRSKLDKSEVILRLIDEHRLDDPKPRLSNAVKILYEINQLPPRINLDDLDLTDLDAPGIMLTGASLNNTILKNADLSNSQLKKCDFTNADLSGAKLDDVNLSQSVLSNATLINSDLTRSNLSGSRFFKTHLENADAQRANFSGSVCEETFLNKTNFTEANLVAVDFSNAIAIETKFIRSNLVNADFNDCDLYNSELDDANIINAIFARSKRLPINKKEILSRGGKL